MIALLGGGAATGFYFLRAGDAPRTNLTARSIRPERRMIGNIVNATGTIRLRVGAEVRVGSQLSGLVKKLNVTVGSHVDAGEVIAEIDDAPIQARLAQAEAQAELDRTTMERADMNSDRAQRLGSQGLIPMPQQQDMRLAFEEAKAKYDKSLRDRDFVTVDLNYVEIRAPISGTVAHPIAC